MRPAQHTHPLHACNQVTTLGVQLSIGSRWTGALTNGGAVAIPVAVCVTYSLPPLTPHPALMLCVRVRVVQPPTSHTSPLAPCVCACFVCMCLTGGGGGGSQRGWGGTGGGGMGRGAANNRGSPRRVAGGGGYQQGPGQGPQQQGGGGYQAGPGAGAKRLRRPDYRSDQSDSPSTSSSGRQGQGHRERPGHQGQVQGGQVRTCG